MTASLLIRGAVLLVGAIACAKVGFNYPDPSGPRYARRWSGEARQRDRDPEALRVVSFNIKFARDIERAICALQHESLAKADLVLLQEMDLTGTERIACALELSYVFYPAALHPGTGRPLRPFGVAVLSPWPIVDDRKRPLTPSSRRDAAQKTAMAATVWIGGRPVRVLNLHLQSGLEPEQLGEQFREALEVLGTVTVAGHDASGTVVAGDFNTFKRAHLEVLASVAKEARFQPALPPGIATFSFAGITLPVQLDHILVRGLTLSRSGRGLRAGSDHFPVWADLRFEGPAPAPAVLQSTNTDPPLVCPEPRETCSDRR